MQIPIKEQSRHAEYNGPTGFATVGPDLGEMSGSLTLAVTLLAATELAD